MDVVVDVISLPCSFEHRRPDFSAPLEFVQAIFNDFRQRAMSRSDTDRFQPKAVKSHCQILQSLFLIGSLKEGLFGDGEVTR